MNPLTDQILALKRLCATSQSGFEFMPLVEELDLMVQGLLTNVSLLTKTCKIQREAKEFYVAKYRERHSELPVGYVIQLNGNAPADMQDEPEYAIEFFTDPDDAIDASHELGGVVTPVGLFLWTQEDIDTIREEAQKLMEKINWEPERIAKD